MSTYKPLVGVQKQAQVQQSQPNIAQIIKKNFMGQMQQNRSKVDPRRMTKQTRNYRQEGSAYNKMENFYQVSHPTEMGVPAKDNFTW